MGFNLQTGDPGLKVKNIIDIEGQKYYFENEQGDDPDKYRLGVGYIGYWGLRVGNDTENRRDLIQNRLIHWAFRMTYFNVDEDRANRYYFQLGTNTVW